MKQLTGFAALVLFSIVSWTDAGNAAQENFEINLNELRPAPSGTIKSVQRGSHKPEVTKSKLPFEPGKTAESSIYTVRPGDHLFLILMRRYNLSNNAAERLIPEVMRMNSISNPLGLTMGQRLTIPLPAPQVRQKRITRNSIPQETTEAVQTTAPALVMDYPQASAQETPPKRSLKPQANQKQTEATPVLREVSISAAPPCILAHEIAQQLDLLVPSTKLISQKDTLTAEHAGLKVVIACGLSPDNTYTYARLLAQHNIQLLVFAGTESSRSVIRKLANRLSLSYQQYDSDDTGSLSPSYLFPATSANGQDIRITIVTSGHEK